ncbi:MAG: acyl-CoA thioesterase [Thermodesulfobacteriota bacterium]|nr:acyl-CoA thioesterase [Thermodesulfobacteriota bacterium]
MRKRWFPKVENSPEPLSMVVERQVRFEEVDALGIVWHGRYPGYFEDARVALSAKYGLGYMDFYSKGVVTPIKQMHVEYHQPLRFEDHFTIEGRWHWSAAARLNFEFILRNAQQQMVTSGYTVQMLLDCEYNMLVVPPLFYQQFLQRWQEGGV